MTVTARVLMQVEITVPSQWSEEWTVAQIRKQAIDDVQGMIRQKAMRGEMKIIGDPKVRMVVVDLDD